MLIGKMQLEENMSEKETPDGNLEWTQKMQLHTNKPLYAKACQII